MSTHNIHFMIKCENFPKIFIKKIVFLGYQENFLGTQKRVRISHCKRAIGVRVIEVYCILICVYVCDIVLFV